MSAPHEVVPDEGGVAGETQNTGGSALSIYATAALSDKESLDLWWGLRGSGPALCVATRFKARAYPVPVVFAGNLI